MTHVKRMLISADPQEVRVAIVEGGKLSEAYIERRGRRSIVGNIYKGRVDAVLPGMEAAFVDIGLPKNGFLYVAEIVLPELDDRERAEKYLTQFAAMDFGYRDVAERLDKLAALRDSV